MKAGICYYKAYQICLKIVDSWGNKKEIKNIFYKIEGTDKPLVFRIPNLIEGGIFINIIILL